jgi:hypothetical protein
MRWNVLVNSKLKRYLAVGIEPGTPLQMLFTVSSTIGQGDAIDTPEHAPALRDFERVF